MKYIKFITKNKLYSAITAVIVVGFLSYFFFIKGNGEPEYGIYTVVYGDVYQEISETGIVRPSKTINLVFETQGKVAAVKVEEGDKVVVGQELVALDRDELNLQVLQARASLETSQAKLDKVLAGASAEDIQVYETAVVNAEVTLQNKKQSLVDITADAESDLEQAREDMVVDLHDAYVDCDDAVRNKVDQFFDNPRGSNPQLQFSSSNSMLDSDVENGRFFIEGVLNSWLSIINTLNDSSDLDAYIETAEQNVNQVKSFLDKVAFVVNDLTAGTSLSQTTIDAWKLAVATARTNVGATLSAVVNQKQAIVTTKITNQTNINTARAVVDTAEASLKTAQNNLALKKATPREADLSLAEAEVRQARASLALKQEKLNKSILRSPIDGVVTKVDIEVGEMTKANTTVASVESEGKFQIEVDIYEEDIPLIDIGNLVDIKIVAFPDEALKGRVVSTNPAEKIVDGVVYYEVEVSFNEERSGLKTGMTADVIIQTDSRENVLVVSKDAVQKRNGVRKVEILRNGIIEEQEIKVGLEGSDNLFEVVSGLNEGDEVIVE